MSDRRTSEKGRCPSYNTFSPRAQSHPPSPNAPQVNSSTTVASLQCNRTETCLHFRIRFEGNDSKCACR